jgi:hypothetical protein
MSCCGSLFVNLGGGGGGTVNTGVLQIAGGVALDSTLRFVEDQNGTDSILQLSTGEFGINRTIALSAGATNVRLINETYTINNSGAQTGTATGIFLNATETALNGMAHNLMDLQVGGVSRFSVANNGTATSEGAMNATSFSISGGGSYSISIGGGNGGRIYGATNGFTFTNLNLTGALFLQLGGTTNAFPAIKKNASSAAIDFRLADDTGFCNISAAALTLSANLVLSSGNAIYAGTQLRIGAGAISILSDSAAEINFTAGASGRGWGVSTATSSGVGASAFLYVGGTATGVTMGSNANANASALLDMVSTTKGFLQPRMTTTDRGNIVSPATGLQLYNTTTNNIDTFDGTNWQSFGKETKITGSLEVNIASGKVINALEVSSAMGLGFYNAAAIIQPVTGGASATYANVSGTEIKENDTFDGYTIGNVVKALRDLGLLA